MIHPSVLLLDEPLSNLDAQLRQEMREELRELQRRLRIATIFVTHDQDEALSLADRVVVMNAGRVEQVGTAGGRLRSVPATPFVAEFIGQYNFLPGHVARAGGDPAPCSGRTTGSSFRWRRAARAVAGQRGIVALRPEAIALLRADAAPSPGANVVRATVERMTYLGALRQYRVTVEAAQRSSASTARSARSASQPGRRREGADVRLAWLPASCTFQPAPARCPGRS